MSFEALVERARALEAPGRRALLGIAGPPGAGKSTFAAALVERLGASARLVGMDGFHLSRSRLAGLGRLDRMGAIDTFDAAGFVAMVRQLRSPNGQVVQAPEFRRDREESVPEAIAIAPSVPLVVVEGNYLLAEHEPWNQLKPLFDAIWFCECEDEVRIERLIARHRASGKPEREARRFALESDQRNADFVRATRGSADLVVRLDEEPIAGALQR